MPKFWVKVIFLFLLAPCAYANDVQILSHYQNIINEWLKSKPQYRLANMADCQCEEETNEIRTREPGGVYKPVPDYLPFFAKGNFVGAPGFAVLAIGIGQKFDAKIVVFDEQGKTLPIVIRYPFVKEKSIQGTGLFVVRGKNRDRLLIGAFHSEAEEVLIQKRK